jgi:hypothetical protein
VTGGGRNRRDGVGWEAQRRTQVELDIAGEGRRRKVEEESLAPYRTTDRVIRGPLLNGRQSGQSSFNI